MLKHKDVRLALSGHRWIQFGCGSNFDGAVEHSPSEMDPLVQAWHQKIDPWVQFQWGSNFDVTAVTIEVKIALKCHFVLLIEAQTYSVPCSEVMCIASMRKYCYLFVINSQDALSIC